MDPSRHTGTIYYDKGSWHADCGCGWHTVTTVGTAWEATDQWAAHERLASVAYSTD